jgi:Coenzyme PQQ synthesis protein D (PqqD)
LGEANPKIRHKDLVVQDLNNEVLIYDLRRDKAFCLNETASAVWHACDGTNTLADIGKQIGSSDIAWLALNDLKRVGLIEHTIETPIKFKGMSRRDIITKIAAGSILALPMITGLYAPVAAQAGSGSNSVCGMLCSQNMDCELARPGPGMGSDCPFCTGPMDGIQTCAAMLFVA